MATTNESVISDLQNEQENTKGTVELTTLQPSISHSSSSTNGDDNDLGEMKLLVDTNQYDDENDEEEFILDPDIHSNRKDELQSSRRNGTASPMQVAVNIFISFVGSGMLGMPYAFSRSGWLLGILSLCTISTMNVYSMLLLVKTRHQLELLGSTNLEGYGDIGRAISGAWGELFVNICLVISQLGFATAYIIFIAANIHNIYPQIERATICLACVPILSCLIQLKDMKHLSPFSLLADVANISGLIAVMVQDWKVYHNDQYANSIIHLSTYSSYFLWDGLIYVSSVSLYSLEGVGMVLSLESSCSDRTWFPSLLRKTLFCITLLMAIFGCCGYFAFGSETLAPITLNLEGNVVTILVKCALCVGLYFTYPIMLFPVNQVMEDWIFTPQQQSQNEKVDNHHHNNDNSNNNRYASVIFRCLVVLGSTLVAWIIPDFGKFLSLVGASICTILGFILPAYFHRKAFGDEIKTWELFIDYFLIIFGIIFGLIGTYQSFVNLISGNGSTH